MINVTCEVKIYEIDGVQNNNNNKISIHSHALHNDRIVIDFCGEKLTVIARDLGRAIQNVTNTGS